LFRADLSGAAYKLLKASTRYNISVTMSTSRESESNSVPGKTSLKPIAGGRPRQDFFLIKALRPVMNIRSHRKPCEGGIISLFTSLPVNVYTTMEDGMAALSCRFDDLKQMN
jgi:hypothetical protein